jgi:hypothetical protein
VKTAAVAAKHTTSTYSHTMGTRVAPQMRKPRQRKASGRSCHGDMTHTDTSTVETTCSAVSTRPARAGLRGARSTIGAMTRIADKWDGNTARYAAQGSSSMKTHTASEAIAAVTVAAKKAERQNRA